MSSLSTGPTDIGYTYHGRKRRWLQTGAVKAAKGVKPYSAKKEACKAETLVPFKNAVTGEYSDNWKECKIARSANDKHLCPVHRRMAVEGAASLGTRFSGGSAVVRFADYDCMDHPSVVFPTSFLAYMRAEQSSATIWPINGSEDVHFYPADFASYARLVGRDVHA